MEESRLKSMAVDVEGMASAEDCFLLYSLVKNVPVEGPVLEIGSFKGRVTVCFAKALQEKGAGKVYSIDADLLKSKEAFLKNIERCGVKERVVPIFAHSAKAWKGWRSLVACIWFDTDADRLVRACDFILWEPYLMVGGVLAFACAQDAQVRRFVQEYVVAPGRFDKVTFAGPVVYAYKTKVTPPYSRRKIGFTRLVHSFNYGAKKVFYRWVWTWCPEFGSAGFALKRTVRHLLEKFLRV